MRFIVPKELWLVLIVSAGYLTFLNQHGRFLQYDEIAYKSPGLHWAQSGRFAAPELTGFWKLLPPESSLTSSQQAPPGLEAVWFINGVLYPFAFGVYTKLVGFGWRVCVWFDALIRVMLALWTYAVARRLAPSQSGWPAALAACAVIVLGTEGRPDELAMSFAMAGSWFLLAPSPGTRAAAASGVCFGLTACTSPTAALLTGWLGLALLLTIDVPRSERARLAVVAGGAVLVPVLVMFAVMQAVHPAALQQYLAISRWNWSAAGVADRASALSVLLFGSKHLAILAAALLVAVISQFARGIGSPFRDWPRLWGGPSAALAVQALLMPSKFFYYWFVGPWVLAASAVSLERLRGTANRRVWVVLAIGVVPCCAVAAVFPVRTSMMLATLPPNQRIGPNEQAIRQLVPKGRRVLDSMSWWSLADRREDFDPYFSRTEPGQVDFIVLGGNGSGALGRPIDTPAIDADEFRSRFHLIHDNLNRSPMTLFGIPVSHSGYGFGFVVFERTQASPSAH